MWWKCSTITKTLKAHVNRHSMRGAIANLIMQQVRCHSHLRDAPETPSCSFLKRRGSANNFSYCLCNLNLLSTFTETSSTDNGNSVLSGLFRDQQQKLPIQNLSRWRRWNNWRTKQWTLARREGISQKKYDSKTGPNQLGQRWTPRPGWFPWFHLLWRVALKERFPRMGGAVLNPNPTLTDISRAKSWIKRGYEERIPRSCQGYGWHPLGPLRPKRQHWKCVETGEWLGILWQHWDHRCVSRVLYRPRNTNENFKDVATKF